MTKPRIIVTGATGKTGSVVVAVLLKIGYPVRAMVRREDGRSAQLKAQGAEIGVADMSDAERVAEPSQLSSILRGTLGRATGPLDQNFSAPRIWRRRSGELLADQLGSCRHLLGYS
jgi:NAD(P)-dependent dehydrogenase (short-subunit alcohol dehydrogenase family)